nr:hypothetical protein CFP56_01755 [Quercus suber]
MGSNKIRSIMLLSPERTEMFKSNIILENVFKQGFQYETLGGSKLTNFLVGANKSQMREEEDIPSANLRLACNSFNNFSGPTGFPCLTQLDLSHLRIIDELDSWMQPEYFPVLKILDLGYTNIVTILESISRFTRLLDLKIRDCKKLQEISRLPQSIRTVDAMNCDRLDTQSSSRLLNQFGEILGILPNIVAQAATSFDSEWPQIGNYLILPVTEIPKWLKFNHHQSVGNSVSFLVGPKFSNLVVCIAFPSKDVDNDIGYLWIVDIFINGKRQYTTDTRWANNNYDHNASVVLRNPIYLLPHLWINVLSTMGKKIQAVLESDADCEEETIDQPMLDGSSSPILLHQLNPTLKRR